MLSSCPGAYPPVSRFHSDIGEAEFRNAISLSNDDPIPRQVSLWLRVPGGLGSRFDCDIARLYREIDLVARLVDRDREVIELHVEAIDRERPIPMAAIRELSDTLRHQFHLSSAASREFGIDVNPEIVTPDQVAALSEFGFNRLGFSAGHLEPLLMVSARESGFRSVSVVTFGAPATVELTVGMRPDRLVLHARDEDAPSRAHQAEVVLKYLDCADYRYVGPDFFALPDDDLALAAAGGQLHCGLFGFTQHAECDQFGFGAGAISRIGGCLTQNSVGPEIWRRELDTGRLPTRRGLCLTEDDELRGELIQQLLCRRQIEIHELERGYGIDFRSYFAAEMARLAPWLRRGLIQDSGDRIAVCSQEWPRLRSIALCFDAYASSDARSQEAGRRH